MAARQISTKSEDGICDLCCRESNGWAIGPCEHPVCYLCATKMRVLCEKNECAVCRTEMDKVNKRTLNDWHYLEYVTTGGFCVHSEAIQVL